MRILDFQNFSKLYEAEDVMQSQTESTLRRIVNSFFMSFGSLSAITSGYDDMLADLITIQRAKGADKIQAMRDAAKSATEKVLPEFKEKGVDTEWEKAANKFSDAVKALFDQYTGEVETTEVMLKKIDLMIEEYKSDLIASKKSAEIALQNAKSKNESAVYESEEIFEGWFTGKKGNIKNLTSQAVALKANLEGQKESKGLESIVSGLIKEVSDIIVKLSTLSTQKRQDIQETELAEIGNRLNEVPLEVIKQEEKFAKQDTANKEASSLYLQGLDIAENAFNMEMEVKDVLAKKAGEEEAKKKEESRIKLSSDLDPAKISARAVNKEVQKFQEEVLKKFADYKPFENWEVFTRFKRFGADGKFGNTTKQMVVALKGGFGVDDKSDVITQELMDKIVLEPLTESDSKFVFLRGFEDFERVIEGFDPVKAKDSVLDAPIAPRGEVKKKEEEDKDIKDEKDAKDKKDPKVLIKEIEDLLIGANESIENLYKDSDYWEEFKGSVNDDEDAAVKQVFGDGYKDKTTWWYKAVRNKFLIPAVKKLAESGFEKTDKDAFDHLDDEIKYFGTIYATLKKKTFGDTGNDSWKWSMRRFDGAKESFNVDTDF